MSRAILEACLPALTALAVACALLVVLLWWSGGVWNIRRLLTLHRCQQGGVQSLAFVLTLPLLVMVLLFIVQVSQLMIGIMVVNYAAFAAARAASVWAPAMIDDSYAALGEDADGQNELPPGITPGTPIALSADTVAGAQSRKYEKVWMAAALACVSIAPSRATPDASLGGSQALRAAAAMKQLYPLFDPAGSTNSRIPQRIDHKVGYSFENTYVTLQFEDRNSQPVDGTRTYNPIGHPTKTYYPSEVGWQDPLTVTVYHDLALLPGAGRILGKLLVRADGRTDRVAPRIKEERGVSKTRLTASATMTSEGLQSLRPYVHPATP